MESLESRRVLAASVYGFDHIVLEARQFGSTIDVDDVEITDLSTNQVVYANTFDAGSTAGLTLVHWADGDAAANFASPLNRVVDGRLRLESTGFQQPGAPLGTQARAVVDAQLPENFEARFTIYKRQASGLAYVTAAPQSARYARDYALMFGTGGFQTFINGDLITNADVFNKPNLLNTPEGLQSQRYLQTDVRYRIVKQGASLQVFIDDILRAQTDSLVNVAPTAITIPNARPVPENVSGSVTSFTVGTLTTADNTNTGGSDTFDYAFVSGPGDDDNAAFQILPNGPSRELWSKIPFDYETKSSYSVRIRSTDRGGLFTEQVFSIAVTDVNEAPTAVALVGAVTTLPDSVSTVARIKIADVVVTDDALGTNALSVAGADAGSFEIDDGGLYLKAGTALDATVKPSYAVTVQARDVNVTVSTNLTLQIARSVVTVPSSQTVTEATTWTGMTPLVKRGAGTLVLDRANFHSGGTVVEAGEVIVRNLSALGTGRLDVRAGAKVTFDVGSVNWNGGTNYVQLSQLQLDPAGRLELGIGQIRVAAGNYDLAAIRAALIAGRNGGQWNGAAGVTSASAGPGTARAIGYRVMPTSNELRLGFAALGDASLDGQVTFTDVSLINNGGRFGQGKTGNIGWADGDFNYSGDVTFTDVSLLNNSGVYGTGSYLPAAPSGTSSGATTTETGTISTNLWAAYALTQDSQVTAKKRR